MIQKDQLTQLNASLFVMAAPIIICDLYYGFGTLVIHYFLYHIVQWFTIAQSEL
jgi:hypothetical protein